MTALAAPLHGPRGRLRAAGAAVALLALVVVPPVLLFAFAPDPLPGSWPSTHSLSRALSAPLSDTAVLRLVAALAWLAWLHLCACLAAEAAAQLRGVHIHVPFGGLNRRLAHHLIAVTVLAVHGSGGLSAAGTVLTPALPVAYPAATTVAAIAPAPASSQNSAPAVMASVTPHRAPADGTAGLAPAPVTRHKEYVVAPPHGRQHDNLWDIAQRHLGDPLRWREIFALNEGRLMSDGQRFTRANLIRPGWVLRMPADAIDLLTVAPPSPRPGADQRHGYDGEAGHAAPAPEVPAVTEPAREVPAPRPTMTAPASQPTDAGKSTPDQHATHNPAVPIGAGLAIGTLGLLVALDRRRRVASRRRTPGVRVAPTPAHLVETEARLRRGARAAAPIADTIRGCVRLAAARDSEVTVRAVLCHGNGDVELMVAPMRQAPAPFTSTARGWLLPATEQGFLLAVDDELADPTPLLVPVGTVDGATCFINLEAARLVAVTGDGGDAVDRFIGALAQSVAGAPWANLAQVAVPERLAPIAAGLERIDVIRPDFPLLDHLAVYADRVAGALDERAVLSDARRTGTADDIGLVLIAGLTSRDVPAALREQLTSPRSPLVAVIAGDDPDAQPWRLDGDRLRLPGIDADITPHLLDIDIARDTAELLEHAAAGPEVAADDAALQPMQDACPPDSIDRAVAVDVLGPVEIRGNGTAKRAGVRDLAVYLALHRRAIPVDVLATTVWPDREFNPDLMRTRMSETRRLLDNGIVHEGRTWRMTDIVGCDWQRFQALAAGDEDDRRSALGLVRGRPFEGYDAEWVQLEGLDRHIEAAVVDLALDVGQRAMDRGDPATATWAANVGISACPYDERLYRLAMRAAAARGASGEARNLLNALRTVLDEQIEPDDRIEPETLAEYDRVMRGQRAAG